MKKHWHLEIDRELGSFRDDESARTFDFWVGRFVERGHGIEKPIFGIEELHDRGKKPFRMVVNVAALPTLRDAVDEVLESDCSDDVVPVRHSRHKDSKTYRQR